MMWKWNWNWSFIINGGWLLVFIGIMILIDLSIVIGYLGRIDDSLDMITGKYKEEDI